MRRAVPCIVVLVAVALFEVALWRRDLLPNRLCIDEPIFDLQGEPLVTVRPQPAFGGAAFFDIGAEKQAIVPIACTFPDQLDGPSCPQFDL